MQDTFSLHADVRFRPYLEFEGHVPPFSCGGDRFEGASKEQSQFVALCASPETERANVMCGGWVFMWHLVERTVSVGEHVRVEAGSSSHVSGFLLSNAQLSKWQHRPVRHILDESSQGRCSCV